LEGGEGKQAAKLIERVLGATTDPVAVSRLQSQMATAQLMQGQSEKAIRHQTEAVLNAPTSIRALARLAELHDLACQPKTAMEALEKAVDLYRSWRAHGRLDMADLTGEMSSLGSGETPSRETLIRRFDEWFSVHRRKLAWYMRWFQKLQPAIRLHRELVADFPTDADSWENLAHLESYAGNEAEAQKALEALVRLRPKEQYVRGMLASRYQWNRLPEQAMEHAVLAGGSPEDVRRRVLTAYVRCGQGEEGLAEFLRRHPGQSDPRSAQIMLADIMIEEQDIEGAKRVLTKLASALPDDDEVLDRLAEVQTRTGDLAAASQTYERLIRRHPDRELYVRRAIEAFDTAHDEKKSIELVARLHEKHPEDASITRELAIRYVQSHRYAEAEPLLDQIVKARPDDENALFHLAILYDETSRRERATPLYEQLLAMGSTKSRPEQQATTSSQPGGALEFVRSDSGLTFPVATPLRPGPAPRKILAFYRKSDSETPYLNRIHIWAESALNHLGMIVDFRDAEDPLPSEREMSTYRGIMTWFLRDVRRGAEPFARWLAEQPYRNRPVVVFDRFGCAMEPGGKPTSPKVLESLQRALGLAIGSRSTENPARIEVARSVSPMVGFERPLAYELDLWAEVKSVNPANTVYLTLKNRDLPEIPCDAIVVGPGGAFCLPTYALYHNLESDRTQWRIDPFRLFSEAYRLQGLPRIDYTTRVGRRMVYVHVDGDGSEQFCRWDPGKTCATKLLELVSSKPQLPSGISFIAALVDPEASADPSGTELVRRFAALPHVEIAHHSYSHPFDWRSDKVVVKAPNYTKMDPQREVVGAAQVLSKIIEPVGRKVDLLFWSGSCNPSRRELELAAQAGLLSINGGQPRMDGNFPSVSHLAPLFRMADDQFQVLTSASNDYFLTDRWELPIAAFKNVIQTYERSGSPRRLTPVNLYYHFYLLSDESGSRTLDEIYDWISRQSLHAVPVSEYIRTTHGFRKARVSLEEDGRWKITDLGRCLTVRFDGETRDPDLSRSRGVIGSAREPGALYVHLDGSGEALIAFAAPVGAPAHPTIQRSTVPVESFKVQGAAVSFETNGFGKQQIVLAGVTPSTAVSVITRSGRDRSERKTTIPVAAGGLAEIDLVLDGPTHVEFSPGSGEPR